LIGGANPEFKALIRLFLNLLADFSELRTMIFFFLRINGFVMYSLGHSLSLCGDQLLAKMLYWICFT